MNLSKYNGTEIANLALGQGGFDIIENTTSAFTAGEDEGRCDERNPAHTSKTICNTEAGGAASIHTNAPLSTHPNTDHWAPSFDSWVSVLFIGDGPSDVVLTPVHGDVVTLTAAEQDDLLGVAIPGPWKTIQCGGSGSQLMCYRG